ncbi:MAG: Holliday junction branch migration protein RuvA [Firmicutes bacterium]|nr:Holliday junction branch migration protein RuvA [Bacillota bacterium]
MIASLRGKILFKKPGEVVIEAGGVGYRALMAERSWNNLGPKGSEVFVFTYLVVREDAMQLFAFETWEEREIFSVLIGVSGIGPKTALGILSQLSLDELVQALVTENLNLLTSINGIGKKTAQRLVVELKDKLSVESGAAVQVAAADSHPSGGSKLQEVIEALVALGYPQLTAARAAQAAYRALGEEAEVQQLIKEALKQTRNLEVNS